MYFVRRKGRVKGPLSREKLLSLQQEDRLRMRDEIGPSEDGPWQRLIDVYDEVFGDESTAAYADNPADDEFWTDDPPAARSAARLAAKASARPAAASKPKTASGGLFGGKVRPWQVIAAISGLTGLVSLAVVVGMLWAPLTEAPADPTEIAATINAENPGPARKGKPRPRATGTKPPATSPAAEGAAPADAASAQPAAQTPAPQPPAPAPVAAQAAAPQADETAVNAESEPPPDPVEAIKSLLTNYYSAGSWQERYRHVKQGDDARLLMKKLYEDVDWISVQWNITRMPGPNDLMAAARGGEPVRVDTLTNGNPHSLYVVFADGKWQIDWLQSLNTLWLSK